MKALLTQLYFIPEFRSLVLDWFGKDLQSSREGRVGEMRQFFEYMQRRENYDGPRIQTTERTDAAEYLSMLLDELEDKLKDTALKSLVGECFLGANSSQIICRQEVRVNDRVYPVDDPYMSEIREEFFHLSVAIKGKKSIREALEAFVEGEALDGENRWMIESGECVDAEKRVCLSQLPRTLFLHLRRYELDWMTMQNVKVNDRCEFPTKLNVEPYTKAGLARREQVANAARRQGMDPDVAVAELEVDPACDYDLIGTVVHVGEASGGFYFSYVKNRGADGGSCGRWEVHKEGKSEPCDEEEMGQACFGGEQSGQSAYILVYRLSAAPELLALEEQMERLEVAEDEERELEQQMGRLAVAGQQAQRQ